MQNFLIALIIIVITGGGYYWYTSQKTPSAETMMPDTSGAMMNGAVQGPASESVEDAMMEDGTMMGTVREFTVSGQPFSFSPNTMTVKKGDTVKITFKNMQGTHDLRIEGYNVGTKVIQTGQSETFTFVADKAGLFEYYCSVGNHRAMGMVGTLTIQ